MKMWHQCKNKWNALRHKYKMEKDAQNVTSGVKSKWSYVNKIDNIIGSSLKVSRLSHGVDSDQPLGLQSKDT